MTEASFIPPLPFLSDDVIRLRSWEPDDAPALVGAWQDAEIADRLSVPDDHGLEAATRWIEGWDARRSAAVALDLVICEWSGDEVCGEVGLSRIDPVRHAALIGWWLAEGSRGRGLASRAVRLMANWALASGWLETLVAEIDADNDRSLRLAARCGFVSLPRVFDRRQVHVLRNPQAV